MNLRTSFWFYLRRVDEKVDRLLGDMQDLKHRVTSLERQVADIRVDMAAAMSARLDRIEVRLDRIERRLELVPSP
jgi:outer membrane murein-binding lipoprotein Lpp